MTPDLDSPVPDGVLALARRLGVRTDSHPTSVHFTQEGRMRRDERASWMKLRARQTTSVDDCGFLWSAHTGPAGLVHVHDSLAEGIGALSVRAFGVLPIASSPTSAALTRGELIRYMAELAWAPDAIVRNRLLQWSIDAPDQFTVTANLGLTTGSVTFTLDSAGRIASAYAPDRPRAVGGRFVQTPWRGRFGDYRHHEGYWLPFQGEAAWIVDGTDVVCWEGTLQTWRTSTD